MGTLKFKILLFPGGLRFEHYKWNVTHQTNDMHSDKWSVPSQELGQKESGELVPIDTWTAPRAK